ncbi:hypothetical protein B0H13DRAFT_1574532, partial [Mycena leptocephala]
RHNLSNMVVLAALRYSPAIQEITSFQNALLRAIAPRLWEDTSRVIDAVVGNDSSLHLPMDPTNDGPYQPTAFSELEYRFSIPDSVPRRDTDDHPSSFRALTAVRHYDSGQGDLVLWRERTVVEFPPGSTFLFPAGLVHYSFSAVEKPGRQMLISQSCSAGLHGYVENGF